MMTRGRESNENGSISKGGMETKYAWNIYYRQKCGRRERESEKDA